MTPRLITLFMAGLAAASAVAQSFNVDINVTSGLGAGVPASSFGGAAAQPGVWNDINPGTPLTTNLTNLNGSASTVTFTRNNVGTFDDAWDVDTSGDYDKLLEDFLYSDTSDMFFTFGNLPSGTYAVYTYAWTPNSTSEATVHVATTSSTQTQYIGGALSSNRLEPGVTHAIHIVSVNAGGSIQVRVVGFGSFGPGRCDGLQLKKIDSNRLRFYVDVNGNNVDGTSWPSAFTNLQIPLVYAGLIGGSSVEIWVANGFYRPTTGTSRDASFVIPNGLLLYGNFAAGETSISQRPAGLFNATYLTGSIGAAGATDNSYHVIDASGAGGTTRIDGFYIVSGYANGSSEANSRGGGAYINNGNPDFINCSFSSNFSSIDGGAVYSRDGSPAFVGCTFYNNNTDGEGGALYQSNNGSPYFLNCRFLGNHAIGAGGAIKILFAEGNAFGCLFSGNSSTAGNGGAVSVAGITGDGFSMINCTVSLNSTGSGSTGGVHVNKGVGSGVPVLELHNSILWGNTDNTPNSVLAKNLFAMNGSIINRTYTTVEGLHSNPLFVDANGANNIAGDFDDDCRLQLNSPCIDAGDNSKVWIDAFDLDGDNILFEMVPYDLDNKVRRYDVPAVANTGAGTNPIIDRGAYEYSFKKGDMNCDGVVDFYDIDPLVAAFNGPAAYNAAYPTCVWLNGDGNCDGTVNFFDIDAFIDCLDGFCSCP